MRTRCAIAAGVNAGLVDVVLTVVSSGEQPGRRSDFKLLLRHGRDLPERGETRVGSHGDRNGIRHADMVHAHGGEIRVSSRVDFGSTFQLEFPAL